MALTGAQWKLLNDALVKAFPGLPQLTMMLQFQCNVALAQIAAPGPLNQVVFQVIQTAEAEGWTGGLVAGARASNPGNADLAAAAAAVGLAVAAPPDHELQVLITQDQGFVNPLSWRERLAALEGRVCHIECPYRGQEATGTGFLVGPSLVLTNHHVVAPVQQPDGDHKAVKLRFDYRKLSDGTVVDMGTVFSLEDDWLVDSSPASAIDRMHDPGALTPEPSELDHALVRVAGEPGNQPVGGKPDPGAPPRGWITELAPALAMDALVFILQHPDGDPISMAGDRVVGINANLTRVRYRTNTAPGSSGSPCFDINWRLGALHHSGDPKHDDLRKPTYNEGIPIDAIAARPAVRAAGAFAAG